MWCAEIRTHSNTLMNHYDAELCWMEWITAVSTFFFFFFWFYKCVHHHLLILHFINKPPNRDHFSLMHFISFERKKTIIIWSPSQTNWCFIKLRVWINETQKASQWTLLKIISSWTCVQTGPKCWNWCDFVCIKIFHWRQTQSIVCLWLTY